MLREVSGGEPLSVKSQLLGFDEKRFRIVHEMFHPPSGDVLATAEHMLLHVNTNKKKGLSIWKNSIRKTCTNLEWTSKFRVYRIMQEKVFRNLTKSSENYETRQSSGPQIGHYSIKF